MTNTTAINPNLLRALNSLADKEGAKMDKAREDLKRAERRFNGR